MGLEVLRTKEDWDSEIKERGLNIFYSYEWYKANEGLWHRSYLFKSENTLFPLLLNVITRRAFSGPWGSYGGPVGPGAPIKDTILQIKKKWLIREIFITSPEPLKELGEPFEVTYSALLNLTSTEEILQNMSENRRRNLKKALKEDFTLEAVENGEGYRRYMELIRRAKRRENLFQPLSLIKKITGLKDALLFFVKGKEDLSGALILKVDQKTLYYWHGVNSEEGLKRHAGDYLHWGVIQFGIENGFRIYNFGTSPMESLLNYKLSWGAMAKPVYTYKV